MKRLKTFEGWGDNSKPKYYVEKGEGYDELTRIKTEILNSMNPPIEDVWETLSDSLLELEENWGKFTTKNEDEIDVVDIGMLDLDVDIKQESNYTIAHETDTFYNRGNTLKITDRKKKEEYRKSVYNRDRRLSLYGSFFDQKLYDFYKKMDGKVKPFYSILVKFESEYVKNNPDKRSEMIKDLSSSMKTALRRLNAKVVKIEYFDDDNYSSERNNWVKVNDLSQVKYPNISVEFEVGKSMLNESLNNEIEVKFVSKARRDLAFNVYKTRDGRITRIEKPNHVHIRFPFEVGQILNRSVETWACNNGFYVDGKDTCPEEKVFGIRKSDIPQGHEIRHLFPHKFRK